VLCYLEGKSNEEAARALRRPVGTIKGRLSRARQMLRSRLARRGLALSVGALAGALAGNASSAALPSVLRSVTLRAAKRFAAGNTSPGGPVSPRVATLTEAVLRSLRRQKHKPDAARWKPVALAFGLIILVTGLLVTGLLLYRARARRLAGGGNAGNARPVAAREHEDQQKLQGNWELGQAEFDGRPMNPGDPKMVWAVQGNRIITNIGINGGRHFTFKLDPTRKPRAIDLTPSNEQGNPVGGRITWAYELDGDTLRVCIPPPGQPARPKEVASKPGSRMMLMVFKRQPPGQAKDGPKK
jgi:uncharacterized protein (TIGR03067 family)